MKPPNINPFVRGALILGAAIVLIPMATVCSADRVPTVFLTHFYATLDMRSYDALQNSPEVAALAHVEERHVAAGGRVWSGFYLYGHETYIELFGAAPTSAGHSLDDSGLGLTVERPGGVAAIADRLRGAFGEKVEMEAVPRSFPQGEVPWFTATDIKSSGAVKLSTWFMEIDPGYLAAKHPGSRIAHPLSRRQYLSWDFLPERPFENVVGLTAALHRVDMGQLASELELAGWVVQRAGGGFVAIGPDVKVTVVPAAGARTGIMQAELRLSQSVPSQEIALGDVKLLLEGETARFVFWTSN